MSPAVSLEERVVALGRASRRAALVSLLGFLLVVAALGYSAVKLADLQEQRGALQREQADLIATIDSSKADVAKYRQEAQNARQAVAASRAAINAFHAGRFEDAVSLYDEALKSDPENAYLQNLRAYALFRLGKVDTAIEGQRLSLAVDPNYAWGYFDLARFLCAASPPLWDEANDAARRAIELRPELLEIMRSDGEFQRVCRGRVP